MSEDINDGVGTYDVVLLVEAPMTIGDATQVRSLHSEIPDQVIYHVLLPLEDASARIEASLGTLGAGDVMAAPAMVMSEVDLEAVRGECRDCSAADLSATLKAIEATGGQATGIVTSSPPVEALVAKVSEVDAREVIVLTRPHLVAEFFHLDWTHRARRKLGVPVLHLLEQETFDEQAGGGEGVTGF